MPERACGGGGGEGDAGESRQGHLALGSCGKVLLGIRKNVTRCQEGVTRCQDGF